MRLYIAEKPSMAAEIAKNLPGTANRKSGYYEVGQDRVTWLYGHILQQAPPEKYDEKYRYWKTEDLPIVPTEWKLLVAGHDPAKSQYKIIKDLCAQATEIIHAGDPDREGQLLVDEVLAFINNKKPVRRLLLNALDEKSVRAALGKIKDNKEFALLTQAGLGRARADWLVGMNLSRAYTLAVKKMGLDMVLPVGRVKTPTLGLIVRREREIANFKAINYYKLQVLFAHENGQFLATWQPQNRDVGFDCEGRLISRAIVDALAANLSKATGGGTILSMETIDGQEQPRLPFSLSALQIEAGKRYGYDPQSVLESAQRLYEKKLTTYPRSDCDYLPTSQLSDARQILANLGAVEELAKIAQGANSGLRSRAWDDGKITAHHALIPTTVKLDPAGLSETDLALYHLIAKAYIVQFYPNYLYKQTKITVGFCGETFSAGGRVIVSDGWRGVWGHEKEEKEDGHDPEQQSKLPKMMKNDPVERMDHEIKELVTTPPKRFTPGSLIQAMKEIHKYVKDPEVKKQLKDVSGIGTEATRAGIINELQVKKLIEVRQKFLIPGHAAYVMIDALPEDMTRPDQTAKMEHYLSLIQQGKGELKAFLALQEEMVKRLCSHAAGLKTVSPARPGETSRPVEPSASAAPKEGSLSKEDLKKRFSQASKPVIPRKTAGSAAGAKKRAAVSKELSNITKGGAGGFGCPECGKKLIRREYQNRYFWGCSGYPACRFSASDNKGVPVFKTRKK